MSSLLRIRSLSPRGFRRAGLRFGPVAQDLHEDALDQDTVRALMDEPMLVVERVTPEEMPMGDGVSSGEASASPADAADAVGPVGNAAAPAATTRRTRTKKQPAEG